MLGTSELCWNFASKPKDAPHIHRFSNSKWVLTMSTIRIFRRESHPVRSCNFVSWCKVKLTFIGFSGSNHRVYSCTATSAGCQLPSLMHMCQQKRGMAIVL